MDWLLSVIDARACWLLRPFYLYMMWCSTPKNTRFWCLNQIQTLHAKTHWQSTPPLSETTEKKENTTPHASFPKIREKKEEEPTLAILHLQRRYLALHPAQKIDPPKLQSRQPFRPGIHGHSIFVAKTATFNLWNVTGRCDHHTTFPVGVVR